MIQRISIKLAFFCVLFFFSFGHLYSQGKDSIYIEYKSSVYFEYRSFEISAEEIEFLTRYKEAFIQDPEIFQKYKVKLESYYCQSESTVDLFIGVKRAKVVIDFFCSDGLLNYRDFIIKDNGPLTVGYNADSDCDYSAVGISLIKS